MWQLMARENYRAMRSDALKFARSCNGLSGHAKYKPFFVM
jgi:hypothetical protein